MALAAVAALTASSFTAAAVVHTLDFPAAKAEQDCSAQNTVKAKAKPVSGIAD